VDILSTFYAVFMTQFVKLMLITSVFFGNCVLFFHCLVYRQNVACPKRFNMYGHYAGEVEDYNYRQSRSCLLNRYTNKQLCCRKEAARCFVSSNILLSHSRSLKVIRNDTVE